MPEQILIDVARSKWASPSIGEIKAPGCGNPAKNAPVVAVALPKTEVEETAEAEAAPAAAGDVEMTKEKKEEGTEGAAPAKAGDKAAPAKAGDKAAPAKADAKAAATAGEKKAAAPAKK
jgi:hypothetical protein